MDTKMKHHSKIVLWAVLLILTLILESCVPIDMEKVFSEKHGTVSDDPVIEQFDANPPGAMAGDTSTLRWRTRNTTSVNISGIGNVPLNGEREVVPGNTYILTATGPGGQSVSEERFIAVYWPQIIGEKPSPQLKTDSPKIKSDPVVKPLKPARTLSIKALSPPAQRSPVHGKRFSHYPRRTTLQWAPVEGASSYTVEIDCYGCCQAGRWCTDVGRTYKKVQSIRATAYTFDFAGAQPGRWRVWAIDKNGNAGHKSPWWTFHYTR